MKVSPDGRDLIASFEGLSLTPYLCPAGVWTIGYGHTAGVTAATPPLASKVAADMLLDNDLVEWTQAVERMSKPVGQHELDAMVSLAFNIGLGAFSGSTVLRMHRAGDKAAAANAFRMWNKATIGGRLQEVPGLTRRRNAEAALYLTPDAGLRPMAFAEMPAEEVAMPQAVAQAAGAGSSKTLWVAGGAGVSTLGAVADQISQVAGSAASASYSVGSLVRVWGPAVLGIIALGCIGYFGWRYFQKVRRGEVAVR